MSSKDENDEEKTTISLRISTEIHRKLKEQASIEERTVSNLAQILLKAGLKNRGNAPA